MQLWGGHHPRLVRTSWERGCLVATHFPVNEVNSLSSKVGLELQSYFFDSLLVSHLGCTDICSFLLQGKLANHVGIIYVCVYNHTHIYFPLQMIL